MLILVKLLCGVNLVINFLSVIRMLQEGTCGLGFGFCGCNTTEQLMLILW